LSINLSFSFSISILNYLNLYKQKVFIKMSSNLPFKMSNSSAYCDSKSFSSIFYFNF
jgi:hypothetical protein